MNYWEECISEAFEDAGITATKQQVDTVASWVEGAHDNYGMAHGHDCIPSYSSIERDQLAEELKKEKSKITCPECSGSGSITTQGPYHSATSDCSKCRGEGRVLP